MSTMLQLAIVKNDDFVKNYFLIIRFVKNDVADAV